MSIELKIPVLGESIQEVQIGRWLKQEGEPVAEDENVVELETDKASMELPAPAAGVLAKILKHDGDSVSIGETIAVLEQDGHPAEKPKADKAKAPSMKDVSAAAATDSAPESDATTATTQGGLAESLPTSKTRRVAPAV